MLRKFLTFHERIKLDWRLLALVAYVVVALLTTILHLWRRGEEGVLLDGFLSVLAGILATIVATTFSFVFVALQLASVQFSPRIVRSFFEYEHFSRFFLWSFLACIAYLLGLQYFGFSDASLIYPKFGIVGSFYLILLVFPLFIHHIIENINASSITNNIARRTISEIDELYEPIPTTEIKSDNIIIQAAKSGYLDSIFYRKLHQLKPKDDAKIFVNAYVGSFVVAGMPFIEIECDKSNRHLYENLKSEIAKQFIISKFRSYSQDIPFGIRQLVDIAIKAISPAVNDPTTALNSIDYIGTILKKATLSEPISKEAKLLQEKNIFIKEFSFEQLVDLSFDQIYQWGKEDYIIVRHLIRTITHLIPFVSSIDRLLVFIRQIEEMELSFLKTDYEELEKKNQEEICPFKRKEHRNSLRDFLEDFYLTVIEKIDEIGIGNEKLEKIKKEYHRNRAFLVKSREETF